MGALPAALGAGGVAALPAAGSAGAAGALPTALGAAALFAARLAQAADRLLVLVDASGLVSALPRAAFQTQSSSRAVAAPTPSPSSAAAYRPLAAEAMDCATMPGGVQRATPAIARPPCCSPPLMMARWIRTLPPSRTSTSAPAAAMPRSRPRRDRSSPDSAVVSARELVTHSVSSSRTARTPMATDAGLVATAAITPSRITKVTIGPMPVRAAANMPVASCRRLSGSRVSRAGSRVSSVPKAIRGSTVQPAKASVKTSTPAGAASALPRSAASTAKPVGIT